MKTNREAKHTPTPWMVFKKEFFISVCTVGQVGERKRIAKDMSEANAEFIVRAVNTHEAKTKFIEKVAGMLIDPGPMTSSKYAWGILEELKSEAQAIAQAEGK